MSAKYGLSGFLAPDGIFYECGYKEHQNLAVELVQSYKVNFFDGNENKVPEFIKFGCDHDVGKEGNGGCHVFMWESPTPKQLRWLLDNLERMTGVQQRSILSNLDSFDINL